MSGTKYQRTEDVRAASGATSMWFEGSSFTKLAAARPKAPDAPISPAPTWNVRLPPAYVVSSRSRTVSTPIRPSARDTARPHRRTQRGDSRHRAPRVRLEKHLHGLAWEERGPVRHPDRHRYPPRRVLADGHAPDIRPRTGVAERVLEDGVARAKAGCAPGRPPGAETDEHGKDGAGAVGRPRRLHSRLGSLAPAPAAAAASRADSAGVSGGGIDRPRISPPGKSPGPVFGGATPSLVWTFTYAFPAATAACSGEGLPRERALELRIRERTRRESPRERTDERRRRDEREHDRAGDAGRADVDVPRDDVGQVRHVKLVADRVVLADHG